MKKKRVSSIIVISVILLGLYALFVYNSLVSKDENAKTSWGQVESQYQRRASLIPNLVATVKGHAKYEKETLQKVIEARAKATQVVIDSENMNLEALQKFQQVQGELSSALSKLMIVVERYPNLKANKSFLTLQAQLEGTENRIAYERRRFNKSVKLYNTYCRSFPNTIFAKMFGFMPKNYFKAIAGADKGAEIQLD